MAAFLFHNGHQIQTVDDTATIKNKPGIQLFFYLCLESNTELFGHTSGYLNPPSQFGLAVCLVVHWIQRQVQRTYTY